LAEQILSANEEVCNETHYDGIGHEITGSINEKTVWTFTNRLEIKVCPT
jgi:hypothetical protein